MVTITINITININGENRIGIKRIILENKKEHHTQPKA